ncbi:fumarylacetoacetate hydrolase family protein [Ramlibacter sp. WS9]|uniref:fumarylacetoacetate hydrolase family protein n=1 Tax=Ramlibacter sp. WS9 TaxID=1882741 RepID=UPI001143077B|nr:fumarylacetoacetate hydrolase family protein [Ramlibacter sp. WS9]ROZ75038.1 FAA hydrolase family protein [Ramlibacter sp. WS9]
MKICRFDDNRLGVLDGDDVLDVSTVLEQLPACRYPLPRHDLLVAELQRLAPAIEAAKPHARRIPVNTVRLLSPVANPGKIVAAPVNYTKHLQEVLGDANLHHDNQINHIERAGLFLKAVSSLEGMSRGVELCHPERRSDPELELVAVIGRTCKNASAADALGYVAGYCVGLDMTIRGPEERSFRKSPDTYCVLGPCLVTADELPDAGALDMTLHVNGEIRQRANSRDLILGVPQLIALASSFYTLHPGDLIYTGTAEGVAAIKAGDRMLAHIDRIGTLDVRILEQAQ